MTSKPLHSSHSSPLIRPLSFNYTPLESENLRPDRTVTVVQSNHHLVPANRQRGQECLYAHISQLGILSEAQDIKCSVSSQGPAP